MYAQFQDALEEGLETGLQRGLEQGLERGRETGILIGRVWAYEKMLKREPTPGATLQEMALDQLQALADPLEAQLGGGG